MTKTLESFRYDLDQNWHSSLEGTSCIIASLKQDSEESVKYWEFQAANVDGELVGEPLVAFSVDAVPGAQSPFPEVIASKHFLKHFMGYTKEGGIAYAIKRYRAITRSRDVSFPEMIGLSKDEVAKIRAGIEGNIADNAEFADMAEKAVSKVLEMLSGEEDKIPDGPVETEERVDETGMRSFYVKGTKVLHREDGPAAIGANGAEMWMKKGQLHRVGGPAIRFPDGSLAYWQNGRLHREDGPAIVDANGEEGYALHGLIVTKELFDSARRQGLVPEATESSVILTKDGKPHNAEGPAIFTSQAQYWARDGFLHNTEGPAALYHDGRVGYFIYGFAFTPEQFAELQKEGLNIEVRPLTEKDAEGKPHHAITFKNQRGALHREGGPAYMVSNGRREWFDEGYLHNLEGPAVVAADGNEEFFIYGVELDEEAFNSVSAQNLDAIKEGDGSLRFYKPGTTVLHRDAGPAVIHQDGKKEWVQDGKYHREDGPAIEYADGRKDWYKEGLLHRWNGPAVELADGRQDWFYEGKRHNPAGPAILYPNGAASYFINDVALSEKEFDDTLEQDLDVEQYSNGDVIFSKEESGDFHREGGPAVKRGNGNLEWFHNGLRHNIDGPAIVRADGTESYYLADKVISKEQHQYIREHKDGVAVDGLVLKSYDDGTFEWAPAPENPDFVMHIKPLEAKTSVDMRAKEDIYMQGDDVIFETKSGNTSISEIQEELSKLAKIVEAGEKKRAIGKDLGLEDLDLDAFLKAAEEEMVDSLEVASRAARVGLIKNEVRNVIDFSQEYRNLSDADRAAWRSKIKIREEERVEASELVDALMEEEADEEMTVEERHAARRAAHMNEVLAPLEGIEGHKDAEEPAEEEEESIGFFPTLAGAALVALAGAAVSGKKSARKIKEKKAVKEEQAAVYN